MCGFTAQLVEHRTGIREVTRSNPVEALIFLRLLPSNCLNYNEAKYNLGKVKTKPMQRCCLGYLGGSREFCRGIAMCFGLSCLFACLLLLGSGKFVYSLVPTLISFRRTVLPRVSSALSGFMPPKRTTRNSLSTYFDMASDPANSVLSPVSPGLPASSSSSAGLGNFVVSSSSASELSLDSLTASIVNAIRLLLNSGRPSDQSAALSLPATAPPAASSSFCLPGPSLSVASTSPSAQLPAAPSSGRPVLVPSFVNTFAVPTMSSLSLPASSLAPCAPSFSLGLSAPLVSPSLQQPFIVGPGFSPVPYKIV